MRAATIIPATITQVFKPRHGRSCISRSIYACGIRAAVFRTGRARVHDWLYWPSYAAIWAIPAAGLWLGVRQRDRELIDVNIALALATLVTNKPYLGWPSLEWDPIFLGVLLIGAAIALRRWLARGPDGARRGFTPAQLLATDKNLLSMVGTASAAFHPHAALPSSAPNDEFRGGASGGGGGGATSEEPAQV